MKVKNDITINKIYFACFLPLVLITLLLISPDIMISLIWLTIGLGVLLIPLPTLTAYGLILLPVTLSINGRRWPYVVFGIVASGLFAFLPSYFGKKHAEQIIDAALQDFRLTKTTARSIEIDVFDDRLGGLSIPQSSCTAECNVLLKSGQLDWVRINVKDGNNPKSSTYKTGKGQICASPGFPALESAVCVFLVPQSNAKADYVIQIKSDASSDLKKLPDLNDWAIVNARLNISGYERGSQAPNYVQQQLDIEVPIFPTVLFATVNDAQTSGGTNFFRSETRHNPLSLKRVLTDLGYKISDAELSKEKEFLTSNLNDGLSPELNKQLMAVLESPQTSDFDAAQTSVVKHWTTNASKQKHWSPKLIALAVQLANDDRLQDDSNIDQVFASHVDITKALLPVVLNRLERFPDQIGNSDTASIVRWTFPKLDPELLYPHADQIVRLVNKPGNMANWLVLSFGRIGRDPSQTLLPLKVSSTDNIPFLRIIAACHAEKKWSHILVPELKKTLLETRIQTDVNTYSDYDSDHRDVLIAALVAHGETEFVSNLLPVKHKQRDKLNSLKKSFEGNNQPDCRY